MTLVIINIISLSFVSPTKFFFFFFLDDRVRAISLAMGMIPVIWTSTADGGKFDTNGLLIYLIHIRFYTEMIFVFGSDWMVAGGSITGNQSVAEFKQILANATEIPTG